MVECTSSLSQQLCKDASLYSFFHFLKDMHRVTWEITNAWPRILGAVEEAQEDALVTMLALSLMSVMSSDPPNREHRRRV